MTNPLPKKISDLTTTSSISNEDLILLVDVSDTVDSPAGSTRKAQFSTLRSAINSGLSISNWNTAYSWGNHATVGYLSAISDESINDLSDVDLTVPPFNGQFLKWDGATSSWKAGNFTEADPVFSSSVAAGITASNVTNWDAAYGWGDHADVGYLTSETSHTDVVVDGDFTSPGLMKREAASGSYSIVVDNSVNWNAAYGWGNHANAGYLTSISSLSINALSDVNTSTSPPTNGQALVWDTANSYWKPGTVASGTTLASIDEIGDVDTTTTAPTNGQVLTWNGTSSTWRPTTVTGTGTVTQVSTGTGLSGGPITTTGTVSLANTTVTPGTYTLTTLTVDAQGRITSAGNGTVSISSIDSIGDVDTTTITPTSRKALVWDSTGSKWVPGDPVQIGRTTNSVTTGSLANGASTNQTLAVGKSYALLKIQTSHAAWVTIYTDATSRTNDASRNETTDPLPGSGVIAEVITTGAATQIITPGTIGWNNDATPTSSAYLKIVNKSGGTAAITVTLTYVLLEE